MSMSDTMKNILLVEPSSSGTALIDACIEMGFCPVVLTAQKDDRKLPAHVLARAFAVIVADTVDDEAAIAAVHAFHREAPLSAVVPGFEYFVPLAANIASSLGLKGLDPAKVENVRLKNLMRQVVHGKGLRSPRFNEVTTVEEGLQAAAGVRFPMVVKPVGWSGSLFVRKVDTPDELADSLHAIFSTSFSEYGIRPPEVAILEEYLVGKEYSVEGYVFEGQVSVVSITEKFLGPEPHFIEVGHITPAPMALEQRQSIEAYVTDVVKALEITVGPFHCEIRVNAEGPVLIEIGARLAGDNICELIALATGIDLCKIAIAAFIGEHTLFMKYTTPSRSQFAGIRYFIRPDLQRYEVANGLRSLDELPGYIRSTIQIGSGESVPPATSSLGRLGYAIYAGPHYEGLRDVLERADQQMAFE